MSEVCLLSRHEGVRIKISCELMNKGGGWLVLGTLLTLLGLASPAHAAEFSCAVGDMACLIEAIHVANGNGEANTLTLEAGTYTLTAVDNDTTAGPTGLPSVTGRLTITGAGADTTILEQAAGAPQFRLLDVAPTGTLTLDGLTLQGGDVAGLPNRGLYTVSGGGGIQNHGTLTLTHSLLRHNVASQGGGIYNVGPLLITHSTLHANSASGNGGGIYFFSASITNSTLSGNVAVQNGGGIFVNISTLMLTSSTVSGNMAGQGGGISIAGGGSSPLLATQSWGTRSSPVTPCPRRGPARIVSPFPVSVPFRSLRSAIT
jgi:hypothetical protein